MPTYVYDILDGTGAATGERFEMFQKMRDDALTVDEHGRPCRRAVVAPLCVLDRGVGKGKKDRGIRCGNNELPTSNSRMPCFEGQPVTRHGHQLLEVSPGMYATADEGAPVIRNKTDRDRWDAYDAKNGRNTTKKAQRQRIRRTKPR